MNQILERLVDSKYKLTPVKEMVSADLSLNMQNRLLKTLEGYQHNLFSGKVGKAKIPLHKLLLKLNATPQYVHLYIILQAIKELTKRELDQLIKKDIIWKTESILWRVPCFVITKKNGQLRIVMNYCHLNK